MSAAGPVGLPSASNPRPRTYLVSGVLGLGFFTLAWVWWDGQPFLGALFMELGGGAFIVFLLEVLVPSALGYAGTVFAALAVTTELVWSDAAVEGLLAAPLDETEQARLFAAIEKGPYPARPTLLGTISDTGERVRGRRVLARELALSATAGPMTMRYYVRDRGLRRRTVVIAGLGRHPDDA
jgi:hypothetical protein